MNNETTESASGGFLDRIKESPRTVSALIIILIVAAAIYAFSGEPTNPSAEPVANAPAATEEATTDQAVEQKVAQTGEISEKAVQERSETLPPVERQDEAYVESAQPGDGITHLARRATARWLAENSPGYEMTQEHRIFIEDYIQNVLGSDRLALGESRSIEFDLIAEATKQAGALSDLQLRNLSQYTAALN